MMNTSYARSSAFIRRVKVPLSTGLGGSYPNSGVTPRGPGSGGIDKVTIPKFQAVAEVELERLHEELKQGTYRPMPVRRILIPNKWKLNEKRPLGIPSIRDRVCQQALKNRLEPICEPLFSECSFGYRPGRSTHQAMRKIYREVMNGCEWIVDADLRDFFGTVHHEPLIDMIAEQVSDGRILKLVRQMLEAGYMEGGKKYATPSGTPQGGLCKALHKPPWTKPLPRWLKP